MTHSLLFDGTLELVGSRETASGAYWFEALADGTSWGEPQPVEVAINSLLRDGALTRTERDDNREVSLIVKVRSVDGRGLKDGVAALHRATEKQTTLVWTPPGGSVGDQRVFEVETSSLGNPSGFDDLAWTRNEQVYGLRLVCLPYWRAQSLTTEVAEGIPSVGTVVNSADSTMGWSTPAAINGGAVMSPQPANMLAVDTTTHIEGTGSIAAKSWKVDSIRYIDFLPSGDALKAHDSVTLTQAISVPAGGYLSFVVAFDSTYGETLTSAFGETYQDTGVLDTFVISAGSASRTYQKVKVNYGDKWTLSRDAIVEALPGGFVRYTLQIDEALSITDLTWTSTHLVPYVENLDDAQRPRILVDQVAVTETVTLGKQILKTVDVAGSARTTGAIHVAAPSDSVALDQVLAYTVPRGEVAMGFRPDLSQWVESGAHTSMIGGRVAFDQIGSTYGSTGSPVFTLPASALRSGAFTVVAPVYRISNTSLSFTIEASLIVAGTVVSTTEMVVQETMPTATWQIRALGTVYLPPAEIQQPGVDAKVRFRFKGPFPPALAELYVFPTEGDLTIIDCGTGTVGPTASSHLWIDSPSPDQPRGGYWLGATPTRQNAISAWSSVVVPGVHSFAPGPMLAFVASLAASGPTVSFDYYERNF